MALWRQAAAEKQIAWRADIPFDLPVVDIDRDQMARALGNLFSNAVKYTPEGGAILVEAGVNQAVAGEHKRHVGFASATAVRASRESEQATIFEPFQRGQADRRFPQGMGLGLSIARDIVVAHGGTSIWIVTRRRQPLHCDDSNLNIVQTYPISIVLKLSPWLGGLTPSRSAMVVARSANVGRTPTLTPALIDCPVTSSGTYSRV